MKSYEQFNSDNLEKLDEGLFSTSKYDVLKEFKGKTWSNALAGKLKDAGIYKAEMKSILSKLGVDENSIKIIDNAHVGTHKFRFLTLDTKKVDELLKNFDTLSKDQINQSNLYTLKADFAKVTKDQFIAAANLIASKNKADSKQIYMFSGNVKDGVIEVVGATPNNQFAGGGSGSAVQTSKKVQQKPAQKPVQQPVQKPVQKPVQ
jgi:hypothetical protein